MNSLTEILRKCTAQLHPVLIGQPKKTCIHAFANLLSSEKEVYFRQSQSVTIRGVTVTPDLYITLPEEAFVHIRCEILSENFEDDILSYEQYRVYNQMAGIPCYIVKFVTGKAYIKLVKNEGVLKDIFAAAQLAQINGGMNLVKLAGSKLQELDPKLHLPLFEKEFCQQLSEKEIVLKEAKSSYDRKVLEVMRPSKMTVHLTVDRTNIEGVLGRHLVIKFGKRGGPNFRFLMDSALSKRLTTAAASTMWTLGLNIKHTKELYYSTFCDELSKVVVNTSAGQPNSQCIVLFQKRENYIYIYSPSIAIVTVKKCAEHSNLLNCYRYLAEEYKNIRGIPCVEIVFGSFNYPRHFYMNFF